MTEAGTNLNRLIGDMKAPVIADLDHELHAIRKRSTLSDEGRQIEIAAAYVNAQREMESSRTGFIEAAKDRRADLTRRLFGATTTMTGSEAVSWRDAADRAAQITSADEAGRMLDQADLSGDSDLRRAIGYRAWTQG